MEAKQMKDEIQDCLSPLFDESDSDCGGYEGMDLEDLADGDDFGWLVDQLADANELNISASPNDEYSDISDKKVGKKSVKREKKLEIQDNSTIEPLTQSLEDIHQWQRFSKLKAEPHPFTGKPGINVDTTGFRPIHYYQLFLTDKFLQYIVDQTNFAASQLMAQQHDHPSIKLWSPTTVDEIKKWFGLIFLMGLVRLPTVNHYWSTDYMFRTDIFRATMTRNRYILLRKCFRLNRNDLKPNENGKKRDALYKLRPLIDHLMDRFQKVYTVEQNVAVDESLLLWKGRLHFRQFMPLKRARFGIKMFCLCESRSGYTYRFRVYTGKDDPVTGMDLELPEEVHDAGKAEKVVTYLSLPLLDQGYNIYMDNWYSSVPLFSYLYERGTNACGTVRSDKLPTMIRRCNILTGKWASFRLGPLMCIKFSDRKMVYMLSTIDNDTKSSVVVSGGQGIRGRMTKSKPACITNYNKLMGGVDLRDSMIKNYTAARKTAEWYKKLSIHLLQVAMHNAYVIFRKDHPKIKFPFIKFIAEVVAGLLSPHATISSPKKSQSDSTGGIRDLVLKTHYPGRWDIETRRSFGKTRPQKACIICNLNGLERQVSTFCAVCAEKPTLCEKSCFQKYHDKYWVNDVRKPLKGAMK